MKEQFIDKSLSTDRLEFIGIINTILDSYRAQGYDLSLRQLYYQLVTKNVVPNTEASYKRVGDIVSDGRLVGLIDWNMIRDRGRETSYPAHWDSPADILEACAKQYRRDKWANQSAHIEVMVEKQALEGVLEPLCRSLDVRFSANKGYASSSFFYEIGQRLGIASESGKRVVILYLGDHDPSGIDMSRDVLDRLCMFARIDRDEMQVDRLALNMDQVEMYRPPPNPAKITDSRAASYIKAFGRESWELDALTPEQLVSVVENAIYSWRDEDLWDEMVAKEDAEREKIRSVAKDFRKENDSE